ncbi:ESX secretion-associated protein EspG [Amycolatopsis minnesotensis]|uniref:ESAT-6 protein secretion system EspG family protein n=1 Tax=Amycolatopsis minnesotensis TaxID=337894 RepID=A0ABN2RMV9_9PSEU
MRFAGGETFSARRLAALVTEATGHGLHVALAPDPVWLGESARARLAKITAADLAQFDGGEPDFREIADLLSKPAKARFGWCTDNRTGIRTGMLAAGSWFGVAATATGDVIHVRTFRDRRLGDVLAEMLPAGVPRAAGTGVTALRSEINGDDGDDVLDVAVSKEVRQFQRLAAQETLAAAELYAAEDARPLRVFDTESGRWAVRTEPYHGDEAVTVTPAGAREIGDLLTH